MYKHIHSIRIEEYNYDLPEARIAKFPLQIRDESKLLVWQNGAISEKLFCTLPALLPQNSLLVFNNTRVIQARLHFHRESGAKIEVFCLEPATPSDYALSFQSTKTCSWHCMVGNLKKWKGDILKLRIPYSSGNLVLTAERMGTNGTSQIVRFSWDNDSVTFAQILDYVGELPLPPYLNRDTEEADKKTYQTVYSKIEGSVAAPTAGLHFTENVFENLKNRGIKCEELTLHVGAGTFKPVKTAIIGEHEMHTEYISISKQLIDSLMTNRTVIAVGTTSVRTLESLYYIGCLLRAQPNATAEELKVTQWTPYNHNYSLSVEESLNEILQYFDRNHCDKLLTSTQIMIAPGYTFRIVKGIVTNFHQPSSTLLLLVSAFVDSRWREIYDYALLNNFRFLSYGDSSLLLRE